MQYGAKNGGNSLGTSPDDGNAFGRFSTLPKNSYYNITLKEINYVETVFYIEAQWNETSASNIIQGAASKAIEKTDGIAQSKGLKHDLVYLNYANADQDPLASYGEDSLNHLKAAAKKYDPRGIFQTQVPGGFKVSKSRG